MNDPLSELSQAAAMVNDLEAASDALLDYFVHRCRREGRSWSEISTVLGVSKQAAHKRFSSPARLGAPSFERFTERARIVLGDAAEQARRLGHQVVGSEHLLLALFEPVDALAAQVLREAGIRRAEVETRVVTTSEPGPAEAAEQIPYTPRAIGVLRRSVEEALQLGHNYIGTEHLLLALIEETDALSSKILVSLGTSYDDVKDRLTRKLAALRH